MTLSEKNELYAAVCLGALGIYVVIEALQLPYVSEFGPGPGFFPLWIGIGLTALSLLLMGANRLVSATVESGAGQSRSAIARALTGWSALMLAIGLLPRLGFVLSIALLTMFLVVALERRSPWLACIVALSVALGFHAVFALALGLSLPAGPWGF